MATRNSAVLSSGKQWIPRLSLKQLFSIVFSTGWLKFLFGKTSLPVSPLAPDGLSNHPADTLSIGEVATSVTRASAAISWQTTLPASGIVLYGASPAELTLQVQQSTISTGHWINIGNLTPKTIYYYQIIARAAAGSALASSIYSFRTMS